MNRRRLASLPLLLVPALVLTGCSGGSSKKQSKHEGSTSSAAAPTTAKVVVAPFTGQPDPTGVSQTRAAMVVKTGNNPEARPQAGLDVADVVYEEIVEGGITRFAAVYQSDAPDLVGPVRSVRGMDPNLALSVGGIFAYSGGTPPNVAKIRATPGVISVDETQAGDAMVRDNRGGRRAPNNLYVRTTRMWAKGGKPIPPRPLFGYLAAGKTFAGTPATALTVRFGGGFDATYTFDAATSTYKRSYGVRPFMAWSGKQVAPTNVVVQFIPYPRNSEGVTIGSGDAWIFSAGQVVKGRWNRPNAADPAVFTDAAGTPVRLTPGRTWVELAKVGMPVDVVTPPPATTAAAPTTAPSRTTRKP
ncbi:MAG: DUF3048 domain-containing protein [Acidimicrobiia bacterium]